MNDSERELFECRGATIKEQAVEIGRLIKENSDLTRFRESLHTSLANCHRSYGGYIERLDAIVVEKAREIEMMKSDLKEERVAFFNRTTHQKALIIELADALRALDRGDDVESNLTDLDRRARDATKYE